MHGRDSLHMLSFIYKERSVAKVVCCITFLKSINLIQIVVFCIFELIFEKINALLPLLVLRISLLHNADFISSTSG